MAEAGTGDTSSPGARSATGVTPRWPRTADEFARFASVQQHLARFMAETPWDQPLALQLGDGGTVTGSLHGIHTRTSATYPIHHAATVIVRSDGGLREIDFLDIAEVA